MLRPLGQCTRPPTQEGLDRLASGPPTKQWTAARPQSSLAHRGIGQGLGGGLYGPKRRGRDSNPRTLSCCRFSRPVRSATLPPLRTSSYRPSLPAEARNAQVGILRKTSPLRAAGKNLKKFLRRCLTKTDS